MNYAATNQIIKDAIFHMTTMDGLQDPQWTSAHAKKNVMQNPNPQAPTSSESVVTIKKKRKLQTGNESFCCRIDYL